MDDDDDEEEEEEEPPARPKERQTRGKLVPAEFNHREPTPLQISNVSAHTASPSRSPSFPSAAPPRVSRDAISASHSPVTSGSKVQAVRQWVTRGTTAQVC